MKKDKLNWTNYCATNKNRNQCSKENCTMYPICLIKNNFKRQGLVVSINQLHDLIDELYEEFPWDGACKVTDDDKKFQINIINKEGLSDTWKIETAQQNKPNSKTTNSIVKPTAQLDTQQKKDKDDGSNVSLSDTPKQLQRQTNKDERMSVSVDMYAENPNDCSGKANVAKKEDTTKVFRSDYIFRCDACDFECDEIPKFKKGECPVEIQHYFTEVLKL